MVTHAYGVSVSTVQKTMQESDKMDAQQIFFLMGKTV
jgi:hypothetical protein